MEGGKDCQGVWENSGDDGNVYYLDSDNGATGIYMCQNYQILYFKYVQFIILQLYLKKL